MKWMVLLMENQLLSLQQASQDKAKNIKMYGHTFKRD